MGHNSSWLPKRNYSNGKKSLPSRKFHIDLKISHPTRKVIFQPPFFGGHVKLPGVCVGFFFGEELHWKFLIVRVYVGSLLNLLYRVRHDFPLGGMYNKTRQGYVITMSENKLCLFYFPLGRFF